MDTAVRQDQRQPAELLRGPMLIDVHNHVMPAEVLDLLRSDPGYGVTIDGDRWTGVHHVPFAIAASFHEPAAKVAEMDAKDIGSAVVSPPPPLFFYEVSSDMGAISLGRWHTTQFLYRMGATSRL